MTTLPRCTHAFAADAHSPLPTTTGSCGHHYHLHCLYECNNRCIVCNSEWKVKGMQ